VQAVGLRCAEARWTGLLAKTSGLVFCAVIIGAAIFWSVSCRLEAYFESTVCCGQF